MLKRLFLFSVAMHALLKADATIQFEVGFEHNGVFYHSKDLSKIPPPEFMAARIEQELIRKKADYIDAGPILRWLAASLGCESNTVYRAEYRPHLDDWLLAATNWPGVLVLKSELDFKSGEDDLFGPSWLFGNLDHPNRAIAKQALLELVVRWDNPIRDPEEDVKQNAGNIAVDADTRLTATIDSVEVYGQEVEVRFTLENKAGRHLWLPHFSKNMGWFLIKRADGLSSVSSDKLKGGYPPSWRLFYAGEKETRTVVFKIGEFEQLYSATSPYWEDPLVQYALKKHSVRFFGDTAIGRAEEKEVELLLTLDNPEFFSWFDRYGKNYMPELPPLNTPAKYYPKKCTGFICDPVSITLNLAE